MTREYKRWPETPGPSRRHFVDSSIGIVSLIKSRWIPIKKTQTPRTLCYVRLFIVMYKTTIDDID